MVVCGLLGFVLFWFAWLSFVWGLGWALVWFSGLYVLVGAVFGFDWFCLESLILAQDERWRRA